MIDQCEVDKRESDERVKKTAKNLLVCWSVKIKSNTEIWHYLVIFYSSLKTQLETMKRLLSFEK